MRNNLYPIQWSAAIPSATARRAAARLPTAAVLQHKESAYQGSRRGEVPAAVPWSVTLWAAKGGGVTGDRNTLVRLGGCFSGTIWTPNTMQARWSRNSREKIHQLWQQAPTSGRNFTFWFSNAPKCKQGKFVAGSKSSAPSQKLGLG